MNTDRPSPDEVIATALSDGDPSHSRGHPTPDGRGRLPPVNTRRVTVVDSRTWLVHMPLAEARHLAGTGHGWPASPQMRLAAALREWVAGISRRRTAVVPVRKVVADLTLILETVPLPQWPVCGPFGPGRAGTRCPARWHISAAGSSAWTGRPSDPWPASPLATTSASPTPTPGRSCPVGADTYLAREEEPDTKP